MQTLPTTLRSHVYPLIEGPEGVVIGKHSGSLEVRFSANDSVRTCHEHLTIYVFHDATDYVPLGMESITLTSPPRRPSMHPR